MAKTILLADDSVTIQKVVELTFMDQDYEVIAVSDGNAALMKLSEMRPDILIADVHMPATNGYVVTRQAKEKYSDLPVLLLVGTFEPFDEQEAQACGADGSLKKPFDSQDLLREVERCVAKSGAAEAPFDEETQPLEPLAAGDLAELQVDDLAGLETQPASEVAPPVEAVEPAPEVAAPVEAAPFDLEATEVTASQDDDLFAESFDEPPLGDPSLDEPPLEYLEDEPETPLLAAEPEAVAAEATSAPPAPASPSIEAAPAPPPPAPAAPAAPAATPSSAEASPEVNGQGTLSDEDVDRIARRVVELLGDSSVREVAWEIVPDLAEVIIKERIRELESQVE